MKMIMKNKYKVGLLGVMLTLSAHSMAAEVQSGTVISAANLDQIKNDTFEGKTIGSMLTEKQEWMIREHGLTMPLRHSESIPKSPGWEEATAKYAGTVSLDPETRTPVNYKAGRPFPNVSLDDPQAGLKLMWNHDKSGGWPRGTLQDYPKFAFLFIDGDKGIERVQHWALIRYFMEGKLKGDPVEGDGSVAWKQLLFAHYPKDIAGIGTYTTRYNDGRLDDSWVYLRSVRRTRRLSGGAWSDPIGGTDQLQDEIEVMSANPAWYPAYKVLGKRTILGVVHSRWPAWHPDEKAEQAKYPTVDLSKPPYWNPIDDWEPREVYVIEATMPEEHPYSKKIMYYDADAGVMLMGENYDKSGDLWKILLFNARSLTARDGGSAIISNQGHTIDFKRRHATIFVHYDGAGFNTPGTESSDVSLNVLEAAGK
ncbi:MAG: DUF1329 domain-containing protein [Porticoccaceae bacterium]